MGFFEGGRLRLEEKARGGCVCGCNGSERKRRVFKSMDGNSILGVLEVQAKDLSYLDSVSRERGPRDCDIPPGRTQVCDKVLLCDYMVRLKSSESYWPRGHVLFQAIIRHISQGLMQRALLIPPFFCSASLC